MSGWIATGYYVKVLRYFYIIPSVLRFVNIKSHQTQGLLQCRSVWATALSSNQGLSKVVGCLLASPPLLRPNEFFVLAQVDAAHLRQHKKCVGQQIPAVLRRRLVQGFGVP